MPSITIPTRNSNESFSAYVSLPDTLPAPAIIVIQEIFGVNEEMRNKCDELAKQGFFAICPDLFWRLEPNVQLTDKSEEEWQKAFDLYSRFDIDLGIEDLRATNHTVKGHADCTGKVGCIGYCLGGKLAYLMAIESSLDCSVGYYGVGIEELLDKTSNIKSPLMLHIAEEDKFVPKEAQEKILGSLKEVANVTTHTYPGADHAFARENGEAYNKESADLANTRTLEFISQNLDIALAA